MGFNIAKAKAELAIEDQGRVVVLQDKNKEPLMDGDQPITVTIMGSYSKVYRRIREQHTQRMVKRRQANPTAEQLLQNRMDLVASCVLAWSGITDDQGNPLPCTKEHALELVSVPYVLEQLEEAQGDHEGFSAPPSGI